MVDPSRPVGPQPIGPLRPEGTGAAKGPQVPPDLFQRTLDQALERLGKASETQAAPAAQQAAPAASRDAALSGAQALLAQLQRMQDDLSARLASFLASPTPEEAVSLSNAADVTYDVHRDVRDRIAGVLQSKGLIA